MKSYLKWILAGVAQFGVASAMAGSLGGVVSAEIVPVAHLVDSIPLPGVGRLGGVSIGSLSTLPGVSKLGLPKILTSPPIVGQITVSEGFEIVESITLPGLGTFKAR